MGLHRPAGAARSRRESARQREAQAGRKHGDAYSSRKRYFSRVMTPRSSSPFLGPVAASLLALVACGGAAPAEAPPTVPPPSPGAPPVAETPAPVERPASVAVWVHVEKPS